MRNQQMSKKKKKPRKNKDLISEVSVSIVNDEDIYYKFS